MNPTRVLNPGPASRLDGHVHVFTDEITSRRQGTSDPAFGLLYADPAARLANGEELIQAMDEDGIACSVVCGFPWRDAGQARAHNAYLLDLHRRYPGRVIPLAAVDPRAPGARMEAERALSAGASGLGEIGVYDRDLDSPEVLPGLRQLAGLCAEADVPLLLHTNEPLGHDYPGKAPMTIRGLYAFLAACRDTRFQLAHLGGGIFFYAWLRKEVRDVLKRCVFDTAACPFLFEPGVLTWFIELMGVEPLLFGSDFPLLRVSRYEREWNRLHLSAEDRERIFGLNARAFWRVDERP